MQQLFKIIPSLLAVKESSVLILRTVLYPIVEAHVETSQASKMDLFARIVNGYILKLLIISTKRSPVDV